ncbi:ABC transporter transmembrane domain-containing protein [Shinella kummerowiae]|jgi:putative ABC transport system ATP-binding protein|uniref:ABC transporter transmembrane domain-containing protein n=1 Tax=Shinella kummerowiae TaxID=417745 RepID=UPI0021B4DB16|nr:ABC transporter transmembrane domain-containing protein [Shinella kummerowiae]MCT7664775.1 ABC transporter transmembrane domain-containing protein [Shinella kummerowiae]
MEKSLARYIWDHTRPQQLWILLIVGLSMIPYYLAFDLPKQIVNGPIQGSGFETPGDTQLFMPISFDLPFWGHVELYSGLPLERMPSLLALSLMFLVLVIINGLFKYFINTYKGRLGERLLRRIRYELVDRILRFPPKYFKHVKAGEVSSMIKDEVEPLGGFTADAFVQPALLGGQALTALIFIFIQHFWLGFIAFAMAAVQVGIIPRMRRRLIELGRERQITARQLAGRVAEIVDGIDTIHAYDTSNYERADIAQRLGRIFRIRYDIYQWKFLVKFLNNFLAQLTPFLFYCIGGYLTIVGKLDVGQLVAVINAYKELPGPLKELIDWELVRQDVQVKYEQVVEQFESDSLIDPEIQAINAANEAVLDCPLSTTNLLIDDDIGGRVLEHVTVKIAPGETVAIIGAAASGGDRLAEALARVTWPAGGKVTAGEDDLFALPESITGRRISYASPEAYFFHGSLKDNLLYGLKHAPIEPAKYNGSAADQRKWDVTEARRSGNPDFDFNSNWIDERTLHANGKDGLYGAMTAVLDVVELSDDVLQLALHSSLGDDHDPELAAQIVEMRRDLREELSRRDLNNLVVPFEDNEYNTEAPVAENLFFGMMPDPKASTKAIVKTAYFRNIMRESGLGKALFEMGKGIAESTVELFSDLPPDHPFFEQLTFMRADEIPTYQHLLQKLRHNATPSEEDRIAFIRLSFFYTEPRHRFGVLDEKLMRKIVEVRHQFHANLPTELLGYIERYNPNAYLTSGTLVDNIVFGKLNHRFSDAISKLREIGGELLANRPELYRALMVLGLESNIGAGGRRMNNLQRLKLGLARALIRRSDYYIFNRAFSGVDHHLQEHIVEAALAFLAKSGDNPAVVWVLSNTPLARHFKRVLAFDGGSLVEDGTYETIVESGTVYKQLIA